MTTEPGRRLEVHADLRLESPAGAARLVADGGRLRLVTDNAGQLLKDAADAGSPAGPASLRALVRQTGASLDQAGLSLVVVGPAGELVRLGRGHGSALGRVLSGSPHLEVGSIGPLIAGAGRYARSAAPGRVTRASIALGAAAVVVAWAAAHGPFRRRRVGPAVATS